MCGEGFLEKELWPFIKRHNQPEAIWQGENWGVNKSFTAFSFCPLILGWPSWKPESKGAGGWSPDGLAPGVKSRMDTDWIRRSKWKKSGTGGFTFMLNEDLTFKSCYLSETMEPLGMALWQGHCWLTLQIWTYNNKYYSGHFERSLAVTKDLKKCNESLSQWMSF